MKSRLLLAAAALTIGLAFSGTASAQYSPYGLSAGYGFGYGIGYGAGGAWAGNSQVIPYFSQFPPVYYSYPVARPYGFSPYALPPGMIPAELRVAPDAKPEEIINPYFQPDEEKPDADDAPKATTAGDRTAQRMIHNPYVRVSTK